MSSFRNSSHTAMRLRRGLAACWKLGPAKTRLTGWVWGGPASVSEWSRSQGHIRQSAWLSPHPKPRLLPGCAVFRASLQSPGCQFLHLTVKQRYSRPPLNQKALPGTFTEPLQLQLPTCPGGAPQPSSANGNRLHFPVCTGLGNNRDHCSKLACDWLSRAAPGAPERWSKMAALCAGRFARRGWLWKVPLATRRDFWSRSR